MTKPLARPIRQLTPKMGVVLLIADTGLRGPKTHALTGRLGLSGSFITHDGQHLEDLGIEPVAFVEGAYDEDAVLKMLTPPTGAALEEIYFEFLDAITTIADKDGVEVAAERLKALSLTAPSVERTAGSVADAIDAVVSYIDIASRGDIRALRLIATLRDITDGFAPKIREQVLASLSEPGRRELDEPEALALIRRIERAAPALDAQTASDLIVQVCTSGPAYYGDETPDALRFRDISTLINAWDGYYPGDFLRRLADILDADYAPHTYATA